MGEPLYEVIRVIRYVGTRDWVDRQVELAVHGRKQIMDNCYIEAATVTLIPDLVAAKLAPHEAGRGIGEDEVKAAEDRARVYVPPLYIIV